MIRRTLADWFSGRRPEPEREEIAADVALAWERFTGHPALAPCYDEEGPFADAVMGRLTALDSDAERLAAVIAHAETWAEQPPASPYERGLRDAWRTILAIAKKGAE